MNFYQNGNVVRLSRESDQIYLQFDDLVQPHHLLLGSDCCRVLVVHELIAVYVLVCMRDIHNYRCTYHRQVYAVNDF
jgi:hypothetical protein